MAKAVRLADIANICHVSTVTVSKALSGQKGVSEELREKIMQLADEMGYQTPSAARQAKEKQSFNIGILISDKYLDQYKSFYWMMYSAVTKRAISKECFTILEVLSVEDERKHAALPKILRENKVQGLIVIGLLKKEYLDMLVKNIQVPLLFLDFYDRDHDIDSVVADNFYGMYLATNYLFDMGHRDIAYVGTLLSTVSITDRYFGYAKALLEHGQQVRPGYVLDDRNIDDGQRAEDFDFKYPEPMPSAFVCNCDLTAGVLIESLQKKGYRIPEDISVVGFDNFIQPGLCDVEITTYEADITEMARQAIHILLGKMKGESHKKAITVVNGRMVMKESVGKRR